MQFRMIIFVSSDLFDLSYTGIQLTSSKVKISENSYLHCLHVGKAHLAMCLLWPFSILTKAVTFSVFGTFSAESCPWTELVGKVSGNSFGPGSYV